MNINNITFWIFFGFWPIWIIWEIALIIMRGDRPSVELISMVARDRGYQMSAIPFAWGSLAAHFWANWNHLPPYYDWYFGLTFFVLIAIVFGWDWYLWNVKYDDFPLWMRFVRWPGTMLFLGLVNGTLIFPQRSHHLQPF